MERSKTSASSNFEQKINESFTPDQRELDQVLDEFLHQEEKSKSKFFNLSTISGVAMLVVGLTALVQILGLGVGPDMGNFLEILPVIGGILVVLIGFGFIAGKSGKAKGVSKKKISRNFGDRVDINSQSDTTSSSTAGKGQSSSSQTNYKEHDYTDSPDLDDYAFEKRKKLYRLRKNKKLFGVCGGLARYFGVSEMVVRIIFGLGTLLGYGSFFLLYIVLIFIMPKEPKELSNKL